MEGDGDTVNNGVSVIAQRTRCRTPKRRGPTLTITSTTRASTEYRSIRLTLKVFEEPVEESAVNTTKASTCSEPAKDSRSSTTREAAAPRRQSAPVHPTTSGFAVAGRRRPRGFTRRRIRPRKIVVVGDMHCGKSCLVSAYCSDQYSDTYLPTILQCVPGDARVDGHKIDLIVVDAPGRVDHAPIRTCIYEKTDLVMICFALDDPASLAHARDYWLEEVRRQAPKAPTMLVGTKRDVRDAAVANWCQCHLCLEDSLGCLKGRATLQRMSSDAVLSKNIVSHQQGKEVARSMGALAYVECSAKYRDGSRDVFENAAYLAVHRRRRKRKTPPKGSSHPCVIL